MGRKTKIAAATVVALLALGSIGAYAYDGTRKDEIAEGVTIGGVDVGGMEAEEAKRAVRRQLLAPLRRPLRVTYEGETWTLPGERLKVRADLDAAVEEALEVSRGGGLPGRLVRYIAGGPVDERVSAGVAYSRSAVNRFVRDVAEEIDREPRDAAVEPSASSLQVIPAEEGLKLRDNLLTRQLNTAVARPRARTVRARAHPVEPELTADELAAEYPYYLTLDRANFTLRLWRNLELAETYTVAVGQVGWDTPEGLYHLESKQVDPTWYVPESDWAGDLAGEVIPPGPENPLKARWMGFYNGAGIHGTDDVSSLGTAASHGCVRMAIPEVEELYEIVDVGTPIYIG